MTQEIERLNMTVKLKGDEIEDWRKKYSKLEKEKDAESERKIAYFKEEIYKLNNSISSRNNEFEELQRRLSSAVSEREFENLRIEYSKLQANLTARNDEIVQLRGRLLVSQEGLSSAERKEYEQKIVDLELRISDLHEEIVKTREKKPEQATRLSISAHSQSSPGGALFEQERRFIRESISE